MSGWSLFGIVVVSGGLIVSGPKERAAISPADAYSSATSLLRRGSFQESLRLVKRAAAPWRNRRQTEWYWKFRLLEAEIRLEQADLEGARTLLEADAAACEIHSRMEIHRRVLLAKSCLRQRQPDFARARSLLQDARALANGTDLSGARAEVDVLRGQVLARESPDDAERAFQSARESAFRAGDSFQYAAATNNIGIMEQRRSRCDEAIPYFDEALGIWRKLGTDQVAAVTANNLVLCYANLGNFDKALEFSREAMRLVKPSPRLAEVLGETGRLYLVQDQPAEAIPYFQRAIEAARKFNSHAETARWANNLATAYREIKDWDAADAATREALQLDPDPRSLPAMQLNQAAIAAGRVRYEEALRIYEQTAASNAGNPAVLWQAHAGAAGVALAMGDWNHARKAFEDGIRVVEQSQSQLNGPDNKITFLSRLIRFYQDYVDALMDRGLEVRALEVADSSRARVLAEGLSRRQPDAENLRGEAELKSFARRSNSTWLSYWVAPRRSFLWVVTAGGIHSFVLPPASEIARAVEQYRGFIEGAMRDPMREPSEAGRWLFDELVGKPSKQVPFGSRVVIVPDGPLHQLNFETLPVYRDKPEYWIEEATMAVAPSFSICVAQAPRRPAAGPSMLIMGDPEAAGAEYPKLPYAAAEISGVSRRFPAASKRILTGVEARPEAYMHEQLDRFSMIHIAAHGEANRRSPLDSALILSRGERGAKLYARDVMQAPLHADLVTISACRSSGARTYAGEGPVGLAHAFLQAGAAAVIAGLWDVSDRSTFEIMDGMYEQIAAGVTPAEALRSAKIASLRSRYPKPYYWGPFQFYIRRPIQTSLLPAKRDHRVNP